MIEFKNISFRYENNEAYSIRNINLCVKEGDFLVLTGHSGCGKSTLTRCFNGLIPHYYEGDFSGDVFINGQNIKSLEIHEISETVGSVFQDPRSQFFTVDTLSELVFTCENFGVLKEDITNRLSEVNEEMMIETLLNKNIFTLSSGEKQKIAIASVKMLGPKVIILDEPSSNLDYPSIERLRKVLMKLKESGYTIIISEHRLYYLMGLMDSIYIVENACIKTSYNQETFKQADSKTIDEMGLRATQLFKPLQFKEQVNKNSYEILTLSEVAYAYKKGQKVLKNISFSGHSGDVIALVGKNGAGKTTLARILSGIYKENNGYLMYSGNSVRHKERYKEVAFVMQDADYQLFAESVEDELVLGNERRVALQENVDSTLEEIGLSEFKAHHPATLSGGQKQRVTIAQAMIKDSPIIIMDEPTSGLDRQNMNRVCKVVNDMAKAGKLVIVITHDYEFITQGCNRALYLKDGVIKEDLDIRSSHLQLQKCFEDMCDL